MTAATITVEKADHWDFEGWTSLPNALIRDPFLDADGKWAFSWLASHSKEFRFKAEDLAAAGPKGRNHARESIRKCEQHGWLTRHQEKDPRTGRIVGTIYRLHPRPVPVEQRTFVESNAKKRSFPKPDNPRSDPAPDESGAGEPADESAPGTPRSGPAPDGPGAGGPGAGGPGPGQSGVPSRDEKTRGENQEEGGAEQPAAAPDGTGPGDGPPPPRVVFDLDDDDTWLCELHAADPIPVGQWRPPCPPCGGVKKQARKQLAARAAAREAAARAEAEVAASCRLRGWCDLDGFVQERPGVRLSPPVRCDHERSPEQVAAEVRAADAPPMPPPPRPDLPTYIRKSQLTGNSRLPVGTR